MIGTGLAPLWGKSAAPGEAYVELTTHLSDTDAALGLILERLGPRLLDVIAQREGVTRDEARAIARFLAITHDIGKATPAFQAQVASMTRAIPTEWDQPSPAHRLRHERTGFVIMRDYLIQRFGVPRAVALRYAQVTGSHHGRPLSSDEQSMISQRDSDQFGAHSGWADYRRSVLEECAALTGFERLEHLPKLHIVSAQILTSLVVIADWSASALLGTVAVCQHDPARVSEALKALDLPASWRPTPRGFTPFGIDPYPAQRMVADAATAQTEPTLTIIEAPMGEGKSEASLVAAETLAARMGLDGVTIALPTQATTAAMHARVAAWVDPGARGDVWLGHSRARTRLTSTFLDDHRRLAPMSPVSVTTIDQALRGVLRTPFAALPFAGLAGKVVIIDEVHAYDAWTGAYLERLLEWLADAGVPVILMSATLARAQRESLIRAYAPAVGEIDAPLGYPCLSVAHRDGRLESTHCDPAPRSIQRLRLETEPDDDAVLARIERAARDGANVLCVRNTVASAQQTVADLRERGVTPTLAHARFTDADRARIDADLLRRFGKGGTARGQVVVATQVAEASLDVDFDLLISDLAPVDSLLQRAGRTHRHAKERPAGYESPLLVVTGYDPAALTFDYAALGIYGTYAITRTALSLEGRTHIDLPTDIPSLIERVYTDDDWPGRYAARRDAATAERTETIRRQDDLARHHMAPSPSKHASLVSMSVTIDDTHRPAVRDIDDSRRAVLVARDHTGRLTYLAAQGIEHRGLERMPTDERSAAARSSLTLPRTLRGVDMPDAGLRDGSVVLVLDEAGPNRFATVLDGHRVTYDHLGLSVAPLG